MIIMFVGSCVFFNFMYETHKFFMFETNFIYGKFAIFKSPHDTLNATSTVTHYVTLCHTVTHYVTLCHTMSHYVTLCHTMSHYVTLWHTMTHYVTIWHTNTHYDTLCGRPPLGVTLALARWHRKKILAQFFSCCLAFRSQQPPLKTFLEVVKLWIFF